MGFMGFFKLFFWFTRKTGHYRRRNRDSMTHGLQMLKVNKTKKDKIYNLFLKCGQILIDNQKSK